MRRAGGGAAGGGARADRRCCCCNTRSGTQRTSRQHGNGAARRQHRHAAPAQPRRRKRRAAAAAGAATAGAAARAGRARAAARRAPRLARRLGVGNGLDRRGAVQLQVRALRQLGHARRRRGGVGGRSRRRARHDGNTAARRGPGSRMGGQRRHRRGEDKRRPDNAEGGFEQSARSAQRAARVKWLADLRVVESTSTRKPFGKRLASGCDPENDDWRVTLTLFLEPSQYPRQPKEPTAKCVCVCVHACAGRRPPGPPGAQSIACCNAAAPVPREPLALVLPAVCVADIVLPPASTSAPGALGVSATESFTCPLVGA